MWKGKKIKVADLSDKPLIETVIKVKGNEAKIIEHDTRPYDYRGTRYLTRHKS